MGAPFTSLGLQQMSATAPDTLAGRLRQRLWIERAAFGIVILVLLLLLLPSRLAPRQWVVEIDGAPVVILPSRALAEAVAGAGQAAAEEAGVNPALLNIRADARSPLLDTPAVEDSREGVELLEAALLRHAPRGVIYIQGVPAVALPDAQAAEDVLEQIKAGYAENFASITAAPVFKEDIEVRSEPAGPEIWAEADVALAVLRGDAGGGSTHTVASGETGWTIASRHGLSVSDLEARNPGLQLSRLRIGQKLQLEEPVRPPITVVTEGETRSTVATAFDTIVERSAQMYADKRMVRQAGRPGQERVTYQVRAENGKVVERLVARQETIRKPRPQVVVEGTRHRPRSRR
jgi:LysM repeat protein